MEMKYVVPDMAQSFGALEFAGESEPIFERDKNNRRVLARRSYNLYSDVQRGENVVVEIPVQAGEKHFKYEQKVKLVLRVCNQVGGNPIYPRSSQPDNSESWDVVGNSN